MDENITEWNPALDSSIKPQTEEGRISSTSLSSRKNQRNPKETTKKNNDLKIQGHMVCEGRRKQTKSGKGKKKSTQDAEAAKDLGRDVLKPFTSKRSLR